MRYAFCNEMFQGWNVKDVFQCAKDEGYEGVEVAPFTLADSVNDLSAERRREIAAQATEVGVEIIGLHWLLVKPEGLYVNHPDDELRQRTRDYFADMIHC